MKKVEIPVDAVGRRVVNEGHALARACFDDKAAHLFRCAPETEVACQSISTPGDLHRLPGLFPNYLPREACSFCTFPSPIGDRRLRHRQTDARVSCRQFRLAPVSAKTPTAMLLTVIRFTGPDACPDTDDLNSPQLQNDRAAALPAKPSGVPPIRFSLPLSPSCYMRGTLTPRTGVFRTTAYQACR